MNPAPIIDAHTHLHGIGTFMYPRSACADLPRLQTPSLTGRQWRCAGAQEPAGRIGLLRSRDSAIKTPLSFTNLRKLIHG